MLRSTLRNVATAVKESRARGTLDKDALLWANTADRVLRAARRVGKVHAQKALAAARTRDVKSVRDALLDGKMAVEDAARIARREAEQMEAYGIFEKLEGTVHAHRAQAVVMLKFLELEAEKLVAQLPPYRRKELRDVAIQLRDAALDQAQHTRGDPNCGQCTRQLVPELKGGDCCSGMVFMAFDELDALFRVLLGEYTPVIRTWQGDFTRCGLLRGESCVLTPGTRPVVCQAYYCTDYRTTLQEAGRWEPLGELLNKLQDARSQLGFRTKMARRFGLREVHHSADDHPVDFLWERMRTRGARYAASSASATQGGIKPRLKIMQ